MPDAPHATGGEDAAELVRQVEDWASFNATLERGCLTLSVAFAEARVNDFSPGAPKSRRVPSHGPRWYLHRIAELERTVHESQQALRHYWHPSPTAEPLLEQAFYIFCEAAPARPQLEALFRRDRNLACHALAEQLKLRGEQILHSASLLGLGQWSSVGTEGRNQPQADALAFRAAAEQLLEKAGGAATLKEAASMLGVTPQAVHKRIKSGSALGVMLERSLLVPRAQFHEQDGETKIVPGLDRVLAAFVLADEGPWAALQFLVEPNPNLDARPLEALAAGRVEDVVAAARGYLGRDEG